MNTQQYWEHVEAAVMSFAHQSTQQADPAHDYEHLRRVVACASRLARQEGANLDVVLPAAWLHDCVSVPKNSAMRSQASAMAASAALRFLGTQGYPDELLAAIGHAIEAHSFSAGIAPRSIEAAVLRDADRLDSLGAIGVARCLMLSAALGRRLYDPAEPFPERRPMDDQQNAIDHFYVKLLKLSDDMLTPAGRAEALSRTEYMRGFLVQLASELADLSSSI